MRQRYLLLLALALLQTACGFSPVYGDHAHSAPVAGEMNSVAIENIPDRTGQFLRNALIDRMYSKGRPGAPLYSLHVSLGITVQALGIQANSTSTRGMMDTNAVYVLKDAAGKEILKGAAHSITSYNTIEDQYGSLVANEDANERTINEVSEQIVNRLSLFFAERAGTNTAPTNLETPPSGPSPAVLMPVRPLPNQ